MSGSTPIYFSKFLVTEQVFFRTRFSYALVDLKPITKGHVLVVPLRSQVVQLSQLTPQENADYFNTVQLIHQFMKWVYKAQAVNIAIQDGPEAGQSVPHLHTHIIPRYKENNIGDKVYERLDDWDLRRDEYMKARDMNEEGTNLRPDQDDVRIARSMEEMKKEVDFLKAQLEEFLSNHCDVKKWLPTDARQ